MLKRSYLYRLFKHNKILFFVVLLFCIGTAFTNLRGNEITPFFVWGMYSKPVKPQPFYTAHRIIVNNNIEVNNINGFMPPTLFYLNAPLKHYVSILNNHNIDPIQTLFKKKLGTNYEKIAPHENLIFNTQERIDGFLPWFARYISTVLQVKVHHLQIIEDRLSYKNSSIHMDSSYTIATWNQQ